MESRSTSAVDAAPTGSWAPPASAGGRSDVAISATVVADLLDAVPDGLVMLDPSGRLTMVNSRIEEIFGYSRGELLGRPLDMLVPEPLHGRRRDGSEFRAEVSFTPLSVGDDGWMVAAVRDGTSGEGAERDRGAALLTEDRDRIGRQLADTVVRALFGAGLRLQSLGERADEHTRNGLDEVIGLLDTTIREIRNLIFETPGRLEPAGDQPGATE